MRYAHGFNASRVLRNHQHRCGVCVMTTFSDERAVWLGRQILPHEPALRAWLRGRRLDGLEVDDILQETYTRLMLADSVLHIHNPKSYAFQTASSIINDHFRRMKVVSFDNIADLPEPDLVSDTPSPEVQAIDRDELHRVGMAIAALPDKVGQVFTLRRIHGLSQREVSETMGITQSTVEKHMSRGFLLMRDRLMHGGNALLESSILESATMNTSRLDAQKDCSRD